MGARRAVRDAARIGHRDKQLQVDQVEAHRGLGLLVPSVEPKPVSVISRLCR
jgi:hypothetical protein